MQLIRALGRLQRDVGAATVVVGQRDHEKRRHGLGMPVTESLETDVDSLLCRTLGLCVAPLVDLEMRPILQRDDEMLRKLGRLRAQQRDQAIELEPHLFRLATIAVHRREENASTQRMGMIGAESARGLLDGLRQHGFGARGVLQRQQARAHGVQQLDAQFGTIGEPLVDAVFHVLEPVGCRKRPTAAVVRTGFVEDRRQEIV